MNWPRAGGASSCKDATRRAAASSPNRVAANCERPGRTAVPAEIRERHAEVGLEEALQVVAGRKTGLQRDGFQRSGGREQFLHLLEADVEDFLEQAMPHGGTELPFGRTP